MAKVLEEQAGSRLKPQRFTKRKWREWGIAYAFMSLQLIGLLVFIGWPLLTSFYYTFTKWDLVSPEPKWVGLDNWIYFFGDIRIGKVLGNTIWFILTGTTSYLIIALFMAVLMNKPRPGIGFFRTLFFLPWVISQVAVGVMWSWMFNTRSGPVAKLFEFLGFQSPNLLLDERYAMLAIAMVTTWQGIGYGMTLYLAGLKSIPMELYDASKVDGARPWSQFRFITLPLLSPTVLFLTITSIIGAFQLYDPVVILTGGATGVAPGGPHDSTRTIVLYMYNQMFQYNERLSGLGYAATIGWLLAALIFVITLVQWWLSKRWVFYSSGE